MEQNWKRRLNSLSAWLIDLWHWPSLAFSPLGPQAFRFAGIYTTPSGFDCLLVLVPKEIRAIEILYRNKFQQIQIYAITWILWWEIINLLLKNIKCLDSDIFILFPGNCGYPLRKQKEGRNCLILKWTFRNRPMIFVLNTYIFISLIQISNWITSTWKFIIVYYKW